MVALKEICDANDENLRPVLPLLKKLLKLELRFYKYEASLREKLEVSKPDLDYERCKLVKAELDGCFSSYRKATEECKTELDDKYELDPDDIVLDVVVASLEKVSMSYTILVSLFTSKAPEVLTEREARLQKYSQARDDLMSQIASKRKKMVETKKAAEEQANLDQTELKELDERFRKLALATDEPVPEITPSDKVPKSNAEVPPNIDLPDDIPPQNTLFNYYGDVYPFQTSSLNPDKPEFIPQQQNRLQEALIQRAMLPQLTAVNFDGDPLEYRSFIHNFENTVTSVTTDPATQLSHLIDRCRGKAQQVIKNKVVNVNPEVALKNALAALSREFGQRETLVRSAKNAVKNCNFIDGSHDSLMQLSCHMENLKDIMTANGAVNELNSPSITSMIFRKFTSGMQGAFEMQQRAELLSEPDSMPKITFDKLLEFIRSEARYCNSTFAHMTKDTHSKSAGGSRNRSGRGIMAIKHDSKAGSSKTQSKCRYCKGEHAFHACDKFKSLPDLERQDYFKKHGMCFVCTKRHLASNCDSKYRCRSCNKRHHVNLPCRREAPPKQEERREEAVQSVQSNAAVNTTSLTYVPVLPAIARVGNRTLKVNLFIDGGATISTASVRVKEKLQPKTKPTRLTVSGFHQQQVPLSGTVFSLFVKGIGKEFDREVLIDRLHCFENLQMPSFDECFPTKSNLHDNPFLRDIPFGEVDDTAIDILVGRDVPILHRVLEDRCRPEFDTVHACRSVIGWYLAGPSRRAVLQRQGEDKSVQYVYFTNSMKSDDALENHLRRMERYDFDDPCYSMKVGKSQDDLKAQRIVDESIRKEQGSYEIALTWRDERGAMPDNRQQAEKRLLGLIPQFKRKPEFQKQYADKMNENITQHAEKVTPDMEENVEKGAVNYVAHFGVVSANKFRVVNDAAAKSLDGKSLNDRLFAGEDINTSMISVLLRSRQHRFLFICDIRSMFLSVGVAEKDRDALRFLWFEDGDFEKPIVAYRWKKWCFGLTSAPYAATKALRQTALDNVVSAPVEALNIIFKNTYVDDIIKSCRTAEESRFLANWIVKLCASGSFEVTKFKATDPEILKDIDSTKVVPSGSGPHHLDPDADSTKVLGLRVDFNTSQYRFRITPGTTPCTRRGVLKFYMRIFDPLGILNIFVLCVKHILQQAVCAELGWDEPLTPDIERQWLKWQEKLHLLEQIRVEVCVKPCDKFLSIQLHVFVDASKIGYGACAYVRVEYPDHVRLTLVMSKGRICPRKPMSIVKLELQAAVVGVRMKNSIIESFDEIDFTSVHFWSDSQSVLQMIRNNDKRFPIWFSYRITEIHESTELDQWRHCPTELNCADYLSRGVMPGNFQKSKMFFEGAEFLKLSQDQWPAETGNSNEAINVVEQLFVAKKETPFTPDGIMNLINYHSTLWNLKRSVAFVIRVLKGVLHSKESRDPSLLRGRLLFSELTQAEHLIIATVQRDAFPELIAKLKNYESFDEALGNKTILPPDNCELRKLHPVLVNGILRVGGRLRNSPFDTDVKHPIILPKKSNFTALIIDFYHEEDAHMGAHSCLFTIRQKFWIVNGLNTVKKRLKDCMRCKELNKEPCKQVISNLPDFRVTPRCPMFDHTAVDLCGPLVVKVNRSRVKRWVCLFTCSATRASDIQVVHSLTTDAFLKAFIRFMCVRQCQPSVMISDCGTNFVGATRELRKFLLHDLDQKKMTEELQKKSVEWRFHPPHASHRNGLVERLFRIFRKCLTSITKDTVLNDEDFLTAVSQINSIMNNRPIVKLSDDPNDDRTLSPCQLMGGSVDATTPPSEFLDPVTYRRSFENVKRVVDNWWRRWQKEYISTLQMRTKWQTPVKNLEPGDLVLMADPQSARSCWKKAVVEETFPDSLGLVRTALVRTATGGRFRRDVRKLTLLECTSGN